MRNKTVNSAVFAPDKMWLTKEEETCRKQQCLNGRWQFQPVPIPKDYKRNTGTPPSLPMPDPSGYSDTPIYIPSPWNGNVWGPGRPDRSKKDQKYTPDSVYYPSYPHSWEGTEMGWLRRTFTSFSGADSNTRIILHFEAVAGHADVYINGKHAGSHFDQWLPFEFDITDLIKDGENELLVGVRHQRLFDNQSTKYKKMRTTYAHGSNTQNLAGIWNDVYLLALPSVCTEDLYIRPLLDTDTLEMDITLRNDTDRPQTVTISGDICPTVIEGCEDIWSGGTNPTPHTVPGSSLSDPVMSLTERVVLISPNSKITVTLTEKAGGRLLVWNSESPRLYTALLRLETADKIADCHAVRFGWRQYGIDGRNMLLNGETVRLVGDICHPFGPYMFTRRFIISWYNLIKSVGGNAVRLHAQIHPRIFLDVADEMGIMVMDETGIFGSCISLNFEDSAAWERYAAHYDGLILRDRNRPSVFSWSFGNELFAIFLYDDAAKRDEDIFYAKLFELGNRTRLNDTTRPFITCDGDQDLRGTLPVWSKHYGHGTPPNLDHITKPIVVGENGGSYYARPEQLSVFNGEKAFESYKGRAQALGIDLYDNIRSFGKRLAYFSPSELVWFGMEHLPYGYSDFSRLPDLEDGVFFDNHIEGRPGLYIERIPPYVGTLNPGFDPALDECRPLAMVDAMRDALRFDSSLDGRWERSEDNLPSKPEYPERFDARFAGKAECAAYSALGMAGMTFTGDGDALIIDAGSCNDSAAELLSQTMADGGLALIIVDSDTAAQKAADMMQIPITLSGRTATMLRRAEPHSYVDSMALSDMYTA
ncbi:MAG: hypothetical protein FWH14_06185, partial [Oscillospiraceae bacterium]|nr:hypothetical protein [Oscillospiraceae bacterium]